MPLADASPLAMVGDRIAGSCKERAVRHPPHGGIAFPPALTIVSVCRLCLSRLSVDCAAVCALLVHSIPRIVMTKP